MSIHKNARLPVSMASPQAPQDACCVRFPKTRIHQKWTLLALSAQEIPMRKSRVTEAQIVSVLQQADTGLAVEDICRQAGH